MEKIKNKYEIIFGFVTIIISLSAFKEELSKINLNLGYTTFSLANYFFFIVIGLSICLYLYVSENIAQDTKIGKWNLFKYTLNFAYFLFVFILVSPILLATNILIFKIYELIAKNYTDATTTLKAINNVLSVIATITTVISSYLTSKRILSDRKIKKQEEIEEQEIKDLDNATKLFADKYYSHSVLESFKVLETHLYKKITERDIRIQKHNINEIIKVALQEKIIDEKDIPTINDIRGMRNIAAHSDTEYTKHQAEFALNFVRQLLNRKTT
jgi:hypothetical protein